MIMNVGFIDKNLDSLIKKFGSNGVLNLSKYKILGSGDLSKKIKIKALQVSDSARGKIEKVGGSIEEISPKDENPEIKDGKDSKDE